MERLSLQLQVFMGNAPTLVHGGQLLATWRPKAGAARIDAVRLRAERPEVAEEYTVQGAPQRSFLPKPLKPGPGAGA